MHCALIRQHDPLRFIAGIHIVAAWIGIRVAGLRIARAKQDAISQAHKERRILPVGMQIRDRIDLLDLQRRHLFEQRQRFFVQHFGERHVVDNITAQHFGTLFG